MEKKMIPWIATPEYVAQLQANPNFAEVKMENVLDEIVWKIILQNIRWYKETNFEPSEDVIHFFLVERTSETDKYYKELAANEKYVYFLFEEKSRYMSSNSSRLLMEEKLRQGVSTEDVKEENIRYREYVRIKEDVERGDILRKLNKKAKLNGAENKKMDEAHQK